jgi:hypothetical protein
LRLNAALILKSLTVDPGLDMTVVNFGDYRSWEKRRASKGTRGEWKDGDGVWLLLFLGAAAFLAQSYD